jgi:hypothetical protein
MPSRVDRGVEVGIHDRQVGANWWGCGGGGGMVQRNIYYKVLKCLPGGHAQSSTQEYCKLIGVWAGMKRAWKAKKGWDRTPVTGNKPWPETWPDADATGASATT